MIKLSKDNTKVIFVKTKKIKPTTSTTFTHRYVPVEAAVPC